MSVDYKSYPVLYVDDEAANLVTFRYAMEDRFEVVTATSGAQALEILQARDITVLLADQRMPGMTGVELCEHALALRPDTVRIIITAYTDIQAAVEAINRGQVSRYLAKPWSNDELVDTLRTCIDLVHVQRGMRDLEQRILWGGQANIASAARYQITHELGHQLMVARDHVDAQTAALQSAIAVLKRVDSPEARHALSLLDEVEQCHGSLRETLNLLTSVAKRYQGRERVSEKIEEARCDPARIIESGLRIVRDLRNRDTRMSVVLEASPTIAVQPSVLGQILLNLLTNSLEAVEGREASDRWLQIKVDLDGDVVSMSVTDGGPGIPAEHLSRIFEPYFTTKRSGTGLGLSIVRDLTERAGGSVRVRNDHGTTIEVRLPRFKGAPGSPQG